MRRKFKEGTIEYQRTYAGISQALAIRKSVELVQMSQKSAEYDLVVLTRPDLILLKPILLSDYSDNYVYVNQYLNLMGDFHWVFSPKWIHLFSGIIDSIDQGNFHQQHTWIRDYMRQNCGDSYIDDNIHAGSDEEVLRQVKHSGIPIDQLRVFGVHDFEYDTYDVIS